MPRSLTQFLENSGHISVRQIDEARRSQRFFGGSLLYNLVRLKVLPEPDAQDMLAQWMGYPYAPLLELKTIPQQVLRLIQHGAIARRRVLPFKPETDKLFVATARIGNDPFFRDLQQRVGLVIQSEELCARIREEQRGRVAAQHGLADCKEQQQMPQALLEHR